MQIPEMVAKGQEQWAFSVGVQAYIWGLPIVKCWRDRLAKMQPSEPASGWLINRFRHVRELASADGAEFVNAATDFLYSTAVIDLSQGSVRLTAPPAKGRWYRLQVLDAYMDTIANLGTRTFGEQLPPVILAKQGDAVAAAQDEHIVYSDSDFLYIVGRVAADNSRADLGLARELQDGLQLRGPCPDVIPYAPADATQTTTDAADCPPELAFFAELGQIMKYVPPKPTETGLRSVFGDIGLTVEGGFKHAGLPAPVCRGLRRAIACAQEILEAKIYEVGEFGNGWSLVRDIGRYRDNYIVRALVSIHGIWANVPEEAMYFMAYTASDGEVLDGNKRYEIRFAAGALPPVEAFWSLSYYDSAGQLVKNAINRYTINSQYHQLTPNSDGSVSLFIGQQPPEASLANNWLPSHDGQFNLNFRCYNAVQPLLSGDYWLPAIIELNDA